METTGYVVVREICTLTRLPYMEYVPRGGAFERPRIYCTSMYVHIRVGHVQECRSVTLRYMDVVISAIVQIAMCISICVWQPGNRIKDSTKQLCTCS